MEEAAEGSDIEGKRSRESVELEMDVPDYWLYFAKPEERAHFDPNKHRLKLQGSAGFGAGTAEFYLVEESSVRVGVFNGSTQGAGFPLDFLKFLHSATRPAAVIMCGICASLGDIKPGDVCIGDSSMVLQGKAAGINLKDLDLEKVAPASATIDNGATGFWTTLDASKEGDFSIHIGTFIQSPFVMAFDLHFLRDTLKPGDRKLIALDMESWFYFRTQAYVGQQLILPVVKGVSDRGAGKNDEFHAKAINNSVNVALRILSKVASQQALPPLKTQGHSMSNVTTIPKRSRKGGNKSKTVSRATARAALQKELHGDEQNHALTTLDNVLRKSEYSDLGIKNLTQHKNHFGRRALEILARLIGRDLSEIE